MVNLQILKRLSSTRCHSVLAANRERSIKADGLKVGQQVVQQGFLVGVLVPQQQHQHVLLAGQAALRDDMRRDAEVVFMPGQPERERADIGQLLLTQQRGHQVGVALDLDAGAGQVADTDRMDRAGADLG